MKKQAGRGSARSSSTELQSWVTAEPARSVRFRQGTGTGLRDDKLIRSRIHGGTGLGGAAFGDPRVGQGDPGVKTGAFLSRLPVFLRYRRGDHGPNGYDLNGYVWVVGPESPGLTGTHRDSPVAVSPWTQGPKGRAATEPRTGAPPCGS